MVEIKPSLEDGMKIGNWRLDKFLGAGKSMEAYFAEYIRAPLNKGAFLVVRSDLEDVERTSKRVNDCVDVMLGFNHKNIGKILDVEQFGFDERTWYVRELGEKTFGDVMGVGKQMDFVSVTNWIIQYLEGLNYIHREGFVHRDIKPGNLMINSDKVFITDLEIFDPVKDDISNSLSKTKEVEREIWTPEFGSPEQLGLIIAGIDRRSDIYSLMKVYYRALAGKMPEQEKRLVDVRNDLPKEVYSIISKSMKNNPNERYSGGVSLKKDLEMILEKQSPVLVKRRQSFLLLHAVAVLLGLGSITHCSIDAVNHYLNATESRRVMEAENEKKRLLLKGQKEKREKNLESEISNLKKKVTEKNSHIKSLESKLKSEKKSIISKETILSDLRDYSGKLIYVKDNAVWSASPNFKCRREIAKNVFDYWKISHLAPSFDNKGIYCLVKPNGKKSNAALVKIDFKDLKVRALTPTFRNCKESSLFGNYNFEDFGIYNKHKVFFRLKDSKNIIIYDINMCEFNLSKDNNVTSDWCKVRESKNGKCHLFVKQNGKKYDLIMKYNKAYLNLLDGVDPVSPLWIQK